MRRRTHRDGSQQHKQACSHQSSLPERQHTEIAETTHNRRPHNEISHKTNSGRNRAPAVNSDGWRESRGRGVAQHAGHDLG